jgi:hypothetical protein
MTAHSSYTKLPRLGLCLLLTGSLGTAVLAAEDASSYAGDPLGGVERKLLKEPQYKSPPRYALLVLGAKGSPVVWMIEDGNTLYVDKNANGDMTDDGPPIPQSKVRDSVSAKGRVWDCQYVLDEILPADGSRHTKFRLSRWNYGEKEDSYGLSLTVNGRPMYAGWFGTFWSAVREDVPLLHLAGTLRPQMLLYKEFVVGQQPSDYRRLGVAFVNPGSRDGAVSRLSIDALPAKTIPIVQIDWPVPAGKPALQTTHRLKERCCYWCFYDSTFNVPHGISAGTATVKVTLDGPSTLDLTISEFKVQVRELNQPTAVKQ